jgi:hypothetical protein
MQQITATYRPEVEIRALRSLHTPFLDEWSAKREDAPRDRDRLRAQIISTHQAGRQHETLLTAGQTAGVSVPKIRFARTDGAVRRGQTVR